MIQLGEAARYLRSELGLSQRAAAEELGISHIHLNNIENGKTSPSPEMIERFFEAWGVDLYMLAVGMFSDEDQWPQSLQRPLENLTAAWQKHLGAVIRERTRERNAKCSEFES